jgi:hypothetical protein
MASQFEVGSLGHAEARKFLDKYEQQKREVAEGLIPLLRIGEILSYSKTFTMEPGTLRPTMEAVVHRGQVDPEAAGWAEMLEYGRVYFEGQGFTKRPDQSSIVLPIRGGVLFPSGHVVTCDYNELEMTQVSPGYVDFDAEYESGGTLHNTQIIQLTSLPIAVPQLQS